MHRVAGKPQEITAAADETKEEPPERRVKTNDPGMEAAPTPSQDQGSKTGEFKRPKQGPPRAKINHAAQAKEDSAAAHQ